MLVIMSFSSSLSTPISPQITIHPVVKSNKPQIHDLFYADVYHWTRWVRPILLHGILGLLKIPICAWILITIGVGLGYGVTIASRLVWILALLLLVLFVVKLLFFLSYFWYLMPEFRNRNLTELYSLDGFAFFVAKLEDDARILGCVGVQKVNETVRPSQRL